MRPTRSKLELWLVVVSLLALAPVAAWSAKRGAAPASKPAATKKEPAAGAGFDYGDPLLLRGLEWRCIGPYRGGRVTAVSGVEGQRSVYYFGGTGGGVWKTVDGASSWRPISDGQLGTGSVGAIAVAPSDPNVIYAGMGEACIRGNMSAGDGVYKSTDAGRTWKNVGLADTRQIGQVRVDPRDPDRVYVAALGHAFGPNHDRGVYRSTDGGVTWKNVLFVNDSTGAVDLAMDPSNSRVLYASMWQVIRTPWSLESGGQGSGLYRSTDGGDSWKLLKGTGLPGGVVGRIGVTISPADPNRVWAIVESDKGGVYRSDDGGRTWSRTNEERKLRQRAWYFSHIFADPKNADVVYVLNVGCFRSKDGGQTFAPIRTPHGDNHDLWIDPQDPQRMIESNDGGANVSMDGGLSWSRLDNQPTAQFYHVVADDQFPYHLYGAQQDNSTVGIASRTRGFGIGASDWHDVGGCESGYIAAEPGNPDIVFSGCYDGYIGRYQQSTQEERDVSVYPDNPMGSGAEGMKYRFQWTFPIVASPNDPKTLYAAGNILFKSLNEGQSWQAISPDLTRNDPTKLGPSGGPITKDNSSVEYYCTIFAMAESPAEPGVLWTGSDDGLVHVSRDDGKNWSDVTPRDLPAWSMISQIAPSPHDKGTAFVAANRYKLEDDRPFAYVTRDYGKTWKKISDGLPQHSFVRVVREDPVREGLLYCGTESGIYFSPDAGARWWPLRLNAPGSAAAYRSAASRATARTRPDDAARVAEEEPRGMLPVVPVTDLIVKDNDLAVSTQGRSFWILDDIAPLRQMNDAVMREEFHLFAPSPGYLFGGGGGFGGGGAVGQNPPHGALIYYTLRDEPREKDEIALEILDESGAVLRKITNHAEPDAGASTGGEDDDEAPPAPPQPKIPARAGLNRFAWDFRIPDATRFKGIVLWDGSLRGPEVVPGRYQVRLTVGGKSQTQPLEVRKDPRFPTTVEDYQKKFDFLRDIRDKISAAHDAVVHIRDARDQIKSVVARAAPLDRDSSIANSARSLTTRLSAIEDSLYQTRNRSSEDPLNFPIRLDNKLASLAGTVDGANAPPTDQAYDVQRDLYARTDAQLEKLKILLEQDLETFNRLVSEKQIPAVILKQQKPERGAERPINPD
ncbi:MAG TPA: hypothetical protein VMJ70_15515 [Candidatus Sulfotelmatobacter sp.]|nr:hypothetical protein [Candidatus Sulfotelmatobacter sp.]